MSRYRMEDGTVLDTDNATQSWKESRDWNGSNRIGRSTRSQWHDQTLYRSRKGRYYIEQCSRVQGERDYAEWISKKSAAAWLLHNEHEVPDDLKAEAEEVSE